ncbi:MAG: Holliday junction branch migration DNA helicase RuvB [Rickettsiales bacterium]|jgi:Holliday junction DNA helicase RuvB|nr:Holliday junction branch migration DNA helicase RuvB [Rickettsiales bacterium]
MTEKDKKNLQSESILDKSEHTEDKFGIERIRPLKLDDFIGQNDAKDNLKVFIQSAKKREKSMDHILFYGPPGLGKTTLAGIIAHELGVGFKSTSAPMISKSGDLAAIITNLQQGDVLFIDEIHRLSPAIEEVLYSAMEDFTLDVIIGEGPSARSIKIELPPFTFIGATTRTGLLTNPLRDRFGIPVKMNFYTDEELQKIIIRAANLLDIGITDDGASEIARRSRGTPRVANRLLKRIRDFAIVADSQTITKEIAANALQKLQVDTQGLDASDIQYMMCIIDNYGGGPVGIETIAASISESQDTLEEVIEPFLLQKGFLQRTPKGRIISERGYVHLNIKPKIKKIINEELFE